MVTCLSARFRAVSARRSVSIRDPTVSWKTGSQFVVPVRYAVLGTEILSKDESHR